MAVERVITLTIGVEALGIFKDLLTGGDDDILLGIEKYIKERIGADGATPYTDDAMDVSVYDIGMRR